MHELEGRFTYEERGQRQLLLLRKGGDGGLDSGMFTFDSNGDRQLANLLDKPDARGKSSYQANAIHTFNWIKERLEGLTRPAAGAKRSAAAVPDAAVSAAKKAHWLLAFLRTLAERVVWTTTLTPSRRLALDTFLNVNLDSRRVPLKEEDVIKVSVGGWDGGDGLPWVLTWTASWRPIRLMLAVAIS